MSREGPSSNYPMSRPYPSLQSILSGQGLPSSFSAAMQASAQPANLYNSNPFASDNVPQTVAEFSPRSYMKEYRQASRYAPLTRSATETRAAPVSSVVKA